MNRSLKFRVWDKANNKFIDPFRFEWNDYYKTTGMMLLDLNGKIRIADYSSGNGDNSASSVYSEVDNPDNYIVQQYTGLNDKNGNPIYEGDFIRGQFDHGPAGYREEIAPVIWTNEDGYQWNYWDLSTIEVIGNKYQWPCKKPGSFDHNGECLICDCWATDCPFFKLSK